MSESTDRARWALTEAFDADLDRANETLRRLHAKGLYIVAAPQGGVPTAPEMWSVEQIHVLHELREYLDLPTPSSPERVLNAAFDELAALYADAEERKELES